MAEVTQPALYHTAGSAHLDGIDFAGKTGTAAGDEPRSPGQDGQRHITRPNVWFVGVTPRRNPELVVAVLWQNGEFSYYPARIGARLWRPMWRSSAGWRTTSSPSRHAAGSRSRWARCGLRRKPVERKRRQGNGAPACWTLSSSTPEMPALKESGAQNDLHGSAGTHRRRLIRPDIRARTARSRANAGCAASRASLEEAMSPARRFLSFRDFDWALLGMVLVLCTISVLEIYSATFHTRFASFPTKQVFWIARRAGHDVPAGQDRLPSAPRLGSRGLTVSSCLPLVAVKAVGHKVLGARRWISVGPVQFQPSEWVKLVLILVVARYFANLGGRNLTWREIFKAFALVGVPMALVLIQPDLGTTLTYAPILVAGLFLGGINLRQALILSTCAAGVGSRCVDQRQDSEALPEGPAHELYQSRQRPQGQRLPDPAIAHCGRAPGASGAKERKKGPRPRAIFCPFRTRISSLPRSARSTGSWARS